MRFIKFRFLALAACVSLAGCRGELVPTYTTEVQTFDWGSARAWVHNPSQQSVILEFAYANKEQFEGCSNTIRSVTITNPNSISALYDQTPRTAKGDLITSYMSAGVTAQLRINRLPFDFAIFDFPYDLDVEFLLNCSGETARYDFEGSIEVEMVRPSIWLQ